ncbi:ankyrin [Bimuria novae-zelandiae CBS 107.79]|uniref:Ankyrin n=1 Tax=Bimuria novae-zelandiae CBS 107.79 TaxID=1447943 RepID=A0A6A5UZS6_9PLEO|nr:ankyrin [Bimuria novae-zelandiae CBS 107.79]
MAQPTVSRINDLWARAAAALSDNDKRNINFNRPDMLNILAELHATAEKSRQRSVESRWKYTRKNGEVVIIRDVFEKIVRWVDTFKQVGDAAVQYDPGHASLPWAGIRFLLQIAVNDIANYASIVEDLARVAELICRFRLTEELYLQGTITAVKELEKAIVKLYAHILGFLSAAKQYLEQGTMKRITKSAFLTETDLGSSLDAIQAAEKDVDRCMVLVDRIDNTEHYAKLMDILARIGEPLRRMDDGLNNIRDDLQASKRIKIIQWLSSEPYIQHHRQTMQGVLTGTGQWLLSDPVFRKWKDDSASSILWLHGIPGSGKSKLVSVVIEDALARYKAGDSPQPVFFYCSRNPAEPGRSDPQAILASLARQLSCLEPGKPLLSPSVKVFKEKEEEGFASGLLQMDESLSLILQLIAQYPLTTIVIDAMDECNPQKRHELLKALEKILQDSSSLVKIFVSSRNDQDIVLRLRHYPNLEINSQRNSDDIARFVGEQVEQLVQDGRLLPYSDSKMEMKTLIIDKVIESAAGMFRWASMQLQYLCSFELDDDIKSNLGRLPPDLNTLYDELYGLLSTKPGQVQAVVFKNALYWLLCARRTLKTEEFLCAISIDSESGRSVKVASKDLVLKICNNFIVFDPQLDTFRFAHLSVREYLEQKPEYGSSTINALAAEVCLWTVFSASSNIATEELLLKLGWRANASLTAFEQLWTYADIYWPEHCKSAKEQRRYGKLKTMLHHVATGPHGADSAIVLWNNRLRKHLAGYGYWEEKRTLEDTIANIHSEVSIGLFVACAFDFGELIGVELERSAGAIDRVNQKGRSPLHIATRNGSCASLTKLLALNHRIRITQEMVVAAAGNEDSGKEVMALLLDKRGADVQITQEVVVAAAGNYSSGKEVMALLLDKRGDDVQIAQEVFVAAAKNSSSGKEVITLLLDKRGADIQITQEVAVAAAGNEGSGKEVMALLLDLRGADVQITQEITQEVVVAAAKNYSSGKEVMTLLLDKRGADVQITQEVVVAAAKNSSSGKEVITLLLNKRGAEVQITQEVVVTIAQRFDEKVMTLLLDKRGDDVQITQEVVVAAAGNDSGKEVMALLLDKRGADVKITQEVVVAAAGNEDDGKIMEYLHQMISIDITDAVIQSAATSGQERTLRLFDQWAKANIVAKAWVDVARLCASAKEGNAKAVLELTQQGVPPDERDTKGATPLWHAVARNHIDTVRVLLATNAVDVNTTIIGKRTPLFWAAALGYREVVNLLLSHGAKHDYKDVNGRSPLAVARIYGQTKIVQILEAKNV